MSTEEILDARYPSLHFLLRFVEQEPLSFSLHSNNLDVEIARAFASLSLERLQLLYIYGIGLGYYYFPLEKWLAEDGERELVFIEENINVLRNFLKMDHAYTILKHPQVHIRFNMNPKRWHAFLEECASEFPVAAFDMMALLSYKKHYNSKFYRMRLKLYRLTTISYGVFIENFHYNILFENLCLNCQHLPRAFLGNYLKNQFMDIPAIICGAGPSLSKDIDTLRSLDNRALIFAGGSAITALSNHNICPHFGVAIDPNREEYRCFKAGCAFEMPLLYMSRVSSQIFTTCNGIYGYLYAEGEDLIERWVADNIEVKKVLLQTGLNSEALSVTTTCIQIAATFGCNPIIFLGVDLAFTGGQLYVSKIVSEDFCLCKKKRKKVDVSEKLLIRKDIYGKPTHTLVKWVMESNAIAIFAQKNPNCTFINATAGGLGFKNVPNQRLTSISFPHSFDLHNRIHHAIQTHSSSFSMEKIQRYFSTLISSLEQAQSYVKTALLELQRMKEKNCDPETGKLIFTQMELESLDAYSCFLERSDYVFQQFIIRRYRPVTWGSNYAMKWDFLQFKWSSFEKYITFYLSHLLMLCSRL